LRLTIYGREVVLKALLITLVLDVAALLIPVLAVKLVLLVLSVLLISFTLWFFRDPLRKLPVNLKPDEIISPADGRVIIIEDIEHETLLNSKAKMIAVFLSPFNVHVNRIPLSGNIFYYNYIKGDYTAAFSRKSSEKNERTEIGIDTGTYKIFFKQIAGFIARRIVCRLKIGDKVKVGEKFGMIKFGSRVDVLFPHNSLVKVSVNQKVVAGETVLAEVNQ
jgi:phosphatidylserine decarboxylase